MDKDIKDYINSKGEVLLQLLVFEHATGDVTVQTEVGQLRLEYRNTVHKHTSADMREGYTYDMGRQSEYESIREAIDKAVAEQYRQRPKPPYVEKDKRGQGIVHLASGARLIFTETMQGGVDALIGLFNADVPIVDASESQVKSEWKQVFPPKVTAKEPAFTVWRLTVTR